MTDPRERHGHSEAAVVNGLAQGFETNGDWQTIAIDPRIVQACVAGLSHGVIFYDDLGSEWTVRDGNVTHEHMPNRTVHSREQRASAPYFTGTAAPAPPAVYKARRNDEHHARDGLKEPQAA